MEEKIRRRPINIEPPIKKAPEEFYDKQQEPIVLSKVTSDIFLKQENPADLIALYWFYYYTAKWQGTNQAKATTSYAATGLKWGEDKVRRVKKQLINLELIEDIRGKRDKTGAFGKCYIYVKFIWWDKEKINKFNDNDPRCFPQGGEPDSVGNQEGNALSTNKKNALSTNNLNSLNNIHTCFLNEWNKNKIIIHSKITSKRKTIIDKVLKLNDYSQEEIFKAFQNYSTVLHSPDYLWDYPWTLEEFLKRGLDRFVDEAEPLKNKIKSNPNTQPARQRSKVDQSNPTKESLNLFPHEIKYMDNWIKIYSDLTNLWVNTDIWPHAYQPNRDKIYAALIELKGWVNNLILGDSYGHIERVAGSLQDICREYIDWIERQGWLEEGIKEGSLFPDSEMFKNHFIPDLEGDVMDIPIRSRGWKNDSNLNIQTPDEIEEQAKQEKKQRQERKLKKEMDAEKEKENISWMHSCMKKYLLDLDKVNIADLDISRWKKDLDKQEFEKFVIAGEKKHQENPINRGNSYRFLFQNRAG